MEEYIDNYTKLTKELLNTDYSYNELILKQKEINKEKRKKLNKLKVMKEKEK